MARQTIDGQSADSGFETFDEDVTGDHVAPYKFGRPAKTDNSPHESAAQFLSEYNEEQDPREFINLLHGRRRSVSSRILASVLVASAVAIMFALFSSDDMRKIVADAKLSIASMLPAPSAPAQPDSVQLTAEEIELLKDPARLSRAANQTPGGRSATTLGTAPREEIASAYQSATQSEAPAAVAPAATKELSDAEKEALFKQFQSWEVERNARARAQVRPKKAKGRPPTAVMLSPSADPLSTR